MASHGVARSTKVRTEEQRRQDLEKIAKYRGFEDSVREQVATSSYGLETFQLTSKLLRLNPEYYTVWNVRRRCLISGLFSKPLAGSWPSKELPSSSASDTRMPSSAALSPSSSSEIRPAQDSRTAGKSGTSDDTDLGLVQDELSFTIPLLMEFPKCYWIWNYRIWVLEQAIERLPVQQARRIWKEELGLVGKMLDRDRRNYHAWTYRRHVVTRLESPLLGGGSLVESEFGYTTKMFLTDLSNFSAWHNRSKLIPRLLDERKADDKMRKEFLEQELDKIRDALNVGPEDQSLWYYQQFLVSNVTNTTVHESFVPNLTREERLGYLDREILEIKDLLEDYEDIKWIYEILLEYTWARASVQSDSSQPSVAEELEVSQWLRILKKLDPQRAGRWKDLEARLSRA